MLESWIGPQTMTLVQAYVYQPDAEETMPPSVGLIQADIMLETISMGITCCLGMLLLRVPSLVHLTGKRLTSYRQYCACL